MRSEPPPSIQVEYTADFKRDLKRLHKKYRNVRADVNHFVRRLEAGETPGSQVQGTGYTVYKARVRSSNLGRGKSGGYRVLYYLKTAARIVLLTIYAKSASEDISITRIRRIVREHELPPESE
jgi:mRNA-degrading endonuclease RelE of RelBE toxin-antitoxin system